MAHLGKIVMLVLCVVSSKRVTLHSKGEPKYIFFERDWAGFNNIKLQLQSMVAIAAITGRTLALPAPKHADHMDRDYYELDFFDAAKLMSAVSVTLSKMPDKDVLRVEEPLASVDFSSLDEKKDWFFPNTPSRIQHFECLNLNEHDRAVASHAVFQGLVMDHHLEEIASSSLQRLNLTKGNFDCAHVREGDFKTFAPQYHMDDKALSAKLKGMLSTRPVLLVSDERPKLELGTDVKFAGDAYDEGVSGETRIAVDMIMCSRAKEFIGSPLSTFTNGILELRSRGARLEGGADPTVRLYAGAPHDAVQHGNTCWMKRTTFADLKL